MSYFFPLDLFVFSYQASNCIVDASLLIFLLSLAPSVLALQSRTHTTEWLNPSLSKQRYIQQVNTTPPSQKNLGWRHSQQLLPSALVSGNYPPNIFHLYVMTVIFYWAKVQVSKHPHLKYLRRVWGTAPSNCNFQHCKRKQTLSAICWHTSATSARERDTKESREFPSSRLGPSKEVPLVFPAGVGNIFRPFSGEMKLATKKRHISKSLQSVFLTGRIKRRTRKFKMEDRYQFLPSFKNYVLPALIPSPHC